MNTPFRKPLALASACAILVVAAAGATGALATAPNGESATLIARGPLVEPANINRQVDGGRVRIKTDGALDALMVEITLVPGGTGGWHSHAGPFVTIVKEGTLTIVDANCVPHEISAGHAAMLVGSLSKDENLGIAPVKFEVTFVIPHDAASPRIDAPAPAGCTA